MHKVELWDEPLTHTLFFHVAMFPCPCPAATLYPFGDNAGDTRVPTIDDGSSPKIVLHQPFRFFETVDTNLYVRFNYVSLVVHVQVHQ